MAEMTKFTVEGPMTLAYFSDERHSKRVLIDPKDEESKSNLIEDPVCGCEDGENLETKIANEIGFPDDAEFDELYRKMDELRQQGLRTEEGVPDVTRPTKLRITVEVL